MHSRQRTTLPASVDVEKASRGETCDGYASIASLVSSEDEKSGAIFQTFDEAATRNLLYMERRLAKLVDQQKRLDLEDVRDVELLAGAKSVDYFDDELSKKNNYAKRHAERQQLAEHTKKSIKEYRKLHPSWVIIALTCVDEALCLHSQVLNLPRPTQRTLKAWETLTRNIVSDDGGRLRPDMKYSLCSLKEQPEREPISIILLRYFPSLFSVGRSPSLLRYKN